MHYFLGIGISEELQQFYKGWQDLLQRELPYKRWMAPEDLHITVQFLGEASERKAEELVMRLRAAALPSSFLLTFGELSFFGQEERPHVLFTKVAKPEKLTELHHVITGETAALGFKRENRPYRPHLTLAKKWSGDMRLTKEKWNRLSEQFTEEPVMTVSEVTLYSIHPGRIPSYEAIEEFLL